MIKLQIVICIVVVAPLREIYGLFALVKSRGFVNSVYTSVSSDFNSVSLSYSNSKDELSKQLPWDVSVESSRELTYMSFFSSQLDLLKSNGFKELKVENKFLYQESSVKPARIGSRCFANDIFRKVRMTYFDGGNNVQVGTK
jgi:hypothetical protein